MGRQGFVSGSGHPVLAYHSPLLECVVKRITLKLANPVPFIWKVSNGSTTFLCSLAPFIRPFMYKRRLSTHIVYWLFGVLKIHIVLSFTSFVNSERNYVFSSFSFIMTWKEQPVANRTSTSCILCIHKREPKTCIISQWSTGDIQASTDLIHTKYCDWYCI